LLGTANRDGNGVTKDEGELRYGAARYSGKRVTEDATATSAWFCKAVEQGTLRRNTRWEPSIPWPTAHCRASVRLISGSISRSAKRPKEYADDWTEARDNIAKKSWLRKELATAQERAVDWFSNHQTNPDARLQ